MRGWFAGAAVLASLLAGAAAGQEAAKAPAKSPSEFIDEALALAKAKSFHTDEVDWGALSRDAHKAIEGAADALDTYPTLDEIMRRLGDHHSFVSVNPVRRAAYKVRHGQDFDAARGGGKRPTSSFMKRKAVASQRLDVDGAAIAVFNVPPMLGGGDPANTYAQGLYDIQAAAAPWACGFVVDLRGNGGGNVWPMLAGLEPLLGEGRSGGGRDRLGFYWGELHNGQAQIVDHGKAPRTIAHTLTWAALPRLAKAPVAVLLDDGVASSGEGLALSLSGRPNTRSFGAPTFGISTSNEGFDLSDGATLVITTGVMVDRGGKDHPSGVAPDEAIDPHLAADGSDPALTRAAAWVAQHRSCPAGGSTSKGA